MPKDTDASKDTYTNSNGSTFTHEDKRKQGRLYYDDCESQHGVKGDNCLSAPGESPVQMCNFHRNPNN
jgi:hypothetical protein